MRVTVRYADGVWIQGITKMKKKSVTVLLLVVALFLTVLLAGCGKNNTVDTEETDELDAMTSSMYVTSSQEYVPDTIDDSIPSVRSTRRRTTGSTTVVTQSGSSTASSTRQTATTTTAATMTSASESSSSSRAVRRTLIPIPLIPAPGSPATE